MDYYRDQIIQNAPVDIVAASNTAMMPYPKRLGHVNESSPSICSRSDHYILDSAIGSDDVTTEDVLERGEEIGADWVVPVDELNDPLTTTERVVEMFIQREDYDEYTPSILVPLQSDEGMTHCDHYHYMEQQLDRHGFELQGPLAIGGVKDESSSTQIEITMEVREQLDDEYLHMLGGGFSKDWIVTLREVPEIVDGLDMTTVVQTIVSGNKLPTIELEQVDYPQPRGKNSTVMSSMLREYALYMLNYLIGPDIREEDAPTFADASQETQMLINGWKETQETNVFATALD
jgi:hypothetical protein